MSVEYPWLLPVWQSWQQLLNHDRLTGAMLVNAPSGLGVASVVNEFARALVCSNSNDEACGFCHSCELSKSGSHPDIHWVIPEKAGKAITVDQIRQCNHWAQESSQLAGRRLIVIDPADAMNESASNALLKTLESPSASCVFILVTRSKHHLLPTITSRCQLWNVALPKRQDTIAWLNMQTDVSVSEEALSLCHDAPLTTLAFYQDGHHTSYEALRQAFASELSKPVLSVSSLWSLLKDDCTVRLGWLSYLLVQVQKQHFGLAVDATMTNLTRLISYDVAYQKAGELNRMIEQLNQFTGLNTELLVANWLLDLHGKRNVC